MNPNAPSTMFGAWVLAPAILALSAIGWGALVELAVGRKLNGLRYPLGLTAMALVLGSLLVIGLSARATVGVVAVIAFIGLIFALIELRQSEPGARRDRARFWPAITGLAAFGFLMLPMVGSGRAGILGYVFNNDPAAHLTVIELLKTTGTQYFSQPESTDLTVSALFEGSYPLGSHALVLYTNLLSGTEALFLWTPVLVLCAVAGALSVRWILTQFDFPEWACALGGIAAAGSYLPLSYLAQGGLKEVLIASIVMLAAACAEFARREEFVPRSLIPFCVAGGGGLTVMGAAAVAWMAPIALAMLALALWRPREGATRGKVLLGFVAVGGVSLIVLLPQVLDAINFTQLQTAGEAVDELGNLLSPLKWYEALGIWFSPDYRTAAATHRSANSLILVVALFALLIGLYAAWRKRHVALLLAFGSSLLACIWIHFSYSAYYEAKGLVVLSMACATGIVIGLIALTGQFKKIGLALTLILLLGAGWSWWQVYSSVWMSPKDRFTELAAFNQQLAGEGPLLVNERESYAKVILRDTKPNEIWSNWLPYGAVITVSGYIPNPPHTPDTDDYADVFMKRFPFILDRKHPGSRPPGNYALVQESAHYNLWQRTGPAPKEHIGLGVDKAGGAEKLQCDKAPVQGLSKRFPKAKFRIAIAPETVTRQMAPEGKLPPGFVFGPQPGIFARNYETPASAAASAASVDLEAGQKYDVYVQGSFAAGFMNVQDGYPTGEARQDMGTQDGWQRFGTFVAPGTSSAMLAALMKPAWQAGSRRSDLVGPTAFVPTSGDRIVVTTGKGLKKYCGYNVDWIERL